jgi:hypothetical protein
VQVAIKKMERAHLQRYVESEILNHSQLRHPHVVQVRHVAAAHNSRCNSTPAAAICVHGDNYT